MSRCVKRSICDPIREGAIRELHQWLPIGTTLFTIVRSISCSGLSREMDVLVWDQGSGEPVVLSWQVAMALDWRLGKHKAVVVRGNGMDMRLNLATQIAEVLHGSDRALNHQWL